MLLATGAVIALGQVSDYDLLLLGTSMIFAATAAAVLLPWERLPYVFSALIPAVDVIAITLLLWGSIALDPGSEITGSAFVIPIATAGIAVISYRLSQRAEAQRHLVERRSQALQRAAEHARSQESLVTDVLDAVDFGVIRLSPEGAAIVANEAHLRLQNRKELAGAQVYRADGITPLPEDEEPLARAIRHEGAYSSADCSAMVTCAPG